MKYVFDNYRNFENDVRHLYLFRPFVLIFSGWISGNLCMSWLWQQCAVFPADGIRIDCCHIFLGGKTRKSMTLSLWNRHATCIRLKPFASEGNANISVKLRGKNMNALRTYSVSDRQAFTKSVVFETLKLLSHSPSKGQWDKVSKNSMHIEKLK